MCELSRDLMLEQQQLRGKCLFQISEIKMRVDADSERYYMIDKENENLQSHLNLVNAELNQANLKVCHICVCVTGVING